MKEIEDEEPYDKTPNEVIAEFSDKGSSLHYTPYTFRVWNDWIDIVSDHRLVTCEMTCNVEREEEKEMEETTCNLERREEEMEKEQWREKDERWKRNDNGDPEYWQPLRDEMQRRLREWRLPEHGDGNHLHENFLEILNEIARKSLGVSATETTRRRKKIKLNQNLREIIAQERKAFNNWKCGKKEDRQNWKTAYRTILKEKRKEVRKLEKRTEQELITEIERTRTKNPREYWQKLYRLAGIKKKKNNLPKQMKDAKNKLLGEQESLEMWAEAFRELGTEDADEKFDRSFKECIEEELEHLEKKGESEEYGYNRPLELEEIMGAIEKLRRGKAAGIDGMINEIFMYGGEHVAGAVHKLFAQLWEMEEFPTEWSKGLICPIFKGGSDQDKLNPMKYRGITLLSVVGKLFTSVLKNRLEQWCEENKVLEEEQAGFRRSRSTIDHIFTLHELIMNRRPKRTYCCFIDIQKAYDRVWRKGLWKKLQDYGLRGKMWRMLQKIYENVESCVQVNGKKSRFFPIKVGLRQGCILSPLLFDVFINGLIETIKQSQLDLIWPRKNRNPIIC